MATFGCPTDETGESDASVGFASYWKWGSIFTLTEDATITKITMRTGGSTPESGQGVVLAIYNTSGGDPSTLAQKTDERDGSTMSSNSWEDFTGGTLGALSAGDYVLAWCSDASGDGGDNTWTARYYSDSGNYMDRKDDEPPPDSPWGTTNQWADKAVCIYATYTPSAGGLSVPVAMRHYRGLRET